MSYRDRINSSCNYYFRYDEDIGKHGPYIEYPDAPAVTPSGYTTIELPSDSSSDDTPSESLSEASSPEPVKADPNIGMVIIQMDDGGPRPKRSRASDIVIPIDSVSSPEIIKETPVEDGSSTDDNSPILTAEVDSDECTFFNDIVDNQTTSGPDYSSSSSECSSSDEEELNRESISASESDYEDNNEALSDKDSNVSESNVEYDINDEDNDNVDDDVSETTSKSIRSTSNCNRIGISETSLLNLCQRFQNGAARYEEILEARNRLGRQIKRTFPNHQLSSHIALRMFSSLSTSYKLKNIGYVNLDSLPATSDACPVLNHEASGVGDIVEISRENETSISADGTPTENDSTSPVCSTRVDFTPAARSKVEGARTACSEAANEVYSVQSGRENPQAKYDSEVRPNQPGLNMPAVNFHRKKIKEVLPPIPKSTGRSKPQTAVDKSNEKPSAALKSANKQLIIKPEFHNRKQCQVAKPGIPHQLRSVACYRDGKVDVSITGDKRLIPESEPLNVNITFIHKPFTMPYKEAKVTDEDDDKQSTSTKRKPFPSPVKCFSPNIPPQRKIQPNKRPLPPLKHVQKTEKRDFKKLNNIPKLAIDSRQVGHFPNHKALPPLRNVSGKVRQYIPIVERKLKVVTSKKRNKKSTTKQENLNWDIVNDRAQRPPFNTHINTEASERHQKIFADIPV